MMETRNQTDRSGTSGSAAGTNSMQYVPLPRPRPRLTPRTAVGDRGNLGSEA